MLSISTAWNFAEGCQVREKLLEIKKLGLETIELGYTLSDQQVKEIVPLLKGMNIKVSSIHNFCPVPNDEPSPRHLSNYYRLSSLDEKERRKAIEWTKKTIDLAKRVASKAVVIHAGTVEIEHDPFKELSKLYREGKMKTPEFAQLIDGMLNARKKAKPPFMDAMMKSLEEVVPYAQQIGVIIGLETRYYPTEIPNFEEIGYLLNLFSKRGMKYWHDVGHGEVNERLGIRPQLDFLKTFADQMVGMHLHGVELLRDHKAPFVGDFDLKKVFPFLNGSLIKVTEARYATFEELKVAVEKLSVFEE